MNDNEVKEKIQLLHKLLLSLNAYGSLDLEDLTLIEAYLKSAFDLNIDSLENCDPAAQITMPEL